MFGFSIALNSGFWRYHHKECAGHVMDDPFVIPYGVCFVGIDAKIKHLPFDEPVAVHRERLNESRHEAGGFHNPAQVSDNSISPVS